MPKAAWAAAQRGITSNGCGRSGRSRSTARGWASAAAISPSLRIWNAWRLWWSAPIPFWYPPFDSDTLADGGFTMSAITQRPMHIYHSWGTHNGWIRQITASLLVPALSYDLGPRVWWPSRLWHTPDHADTETTELLHVGQGDGVTFR